jgi:hypothetical protein
MRAKFRQGGVQFEVETGAVDAQMLHVLWVASVKHGCHVQVPVRQDGKTLFLNIRCLDEATFDGMLMPRITLPPPPDGSSSVPPAPG